jgi:hypothetical protein
MPSFYVLQSAPTPWGDYGSILWHGIARAASTQQGAISIERNGPFMPPVTFPGIGHVVVTSSVRRTIEERGLTGATFHDVTKARIVQLDWETWDTTLPAPPFYPPDTEPENYVLGQPHDPLCAAKMADCFKLTAPPWGGATRERIAPRTYHYDLQPEAEPPTDFFVAGGFKYTFVTERAKAVLSAVADRWLSFVPVTTGN